MHDACTGDCGRPLFVRDAAGVPSQLGVVGFGKGCGRKDFPGVYARLAYYTEWIRTTIGTKCTPRQIAAGHC